MILLYSLLIITSSITHPPSPINPSLYQKSSTTLNYIPFQNPISPPQYSIYLDMAPQARYNELIKDKYNMINAFIDYLYEIKQFRYSMWMARGLFFVVGDGVMQSYLGTEFFLECKGIAQQLKRQVYEIVVYNYMYEIGAAKDFCTSIAVTQTGGEQLLQKSDQQPHRTLSQPNQPKTNHKQNLNLLARNLDYGFQSFLASNTVKLNFYATSQSKNPSHTLITHAGFISSHTSLKHSSSPQQLQFAITLNQRKSQSFLQTWTRILFTSCRSVFQITNELLRREIATVEQLIDIVKEQNSCSRFYFIVKTKLGDNVLIQKNQGIGASKVIVQKVSQRKEQQDDPFFIVQTNTDTDQPDPDGRRDQAITKINQIIGNVGYVQKQDIKKILLESPNFNELTLMTALIDVQKGQIDAIVWPQDKNSDDVIATTK